jgi:uncharacterized protein (TIGR02145 family)
LTIIFRGKVNNESGFSALPSGGRTINGFDYFGNESIAVYWVAPLHNDHLTICLYAHTTEFNPTEFEDSVGFAIRLIKK